MKTKLKLRYLSAYFSPNKIVLADNEDLTIEILDKGRFSQRTVLLLNGKTYLCENKAVTIPRADLGNINVFELQEREHSTDRVLERVTVENLLAIPCQAEYENNRLITERAFYAQVVDELLEDVKRLHERLDRVDTQVGALENGKFTILKFGGNKHD